MIHHVIAASLALPMTAMVAVVQTQVEQEPNYGVLVVTLMMFFGVLDRVARFAWKYRKAFRIAIQILQALSQHGDTRIQIFARNALDSIVGELATNKEEKDIVNNAQVKAAKITGAEGNVLESNLPSKKKQVAKEMLRFLPVIGRFI